MTMQTAIFNPRSVFAGGNGGADLEQSSECPPLDAELEEPCQDEQDGCCCEDSGVQDELEELRRTVRYLQGMLAVLSGLVLLIAVTLLFLAMLVWLV